MFVVRLLECFSNSLPGEFWMLGDARIYKFKHFIRNQLLCSPAPTHPGKNPKLTTRKPRSSPRNTIISSSLNENPYKSKFCCNRVGLVLLGMVATPRCRIHLNNTCAAVLLWLWAISFTSGMSRRSGMSRLCTNVQMGKWVWGNWSIVKMALSSLKYSNRFTRKTNYVWFS